jgi:hypothetical protein
MGIGPVMAQQDEDLRQTLAPGLPVLRSLRAMSMRVPCLYGYCTIPYRHEHLFTAIPTFSLNYPQIFHDALILLLPSTITDLEDRHVWPAPGHLYQPLHGFLITAAPQRSTTTLPLSPSTPQGGAFDTVSTTRSVLLPENDPCTQHTLQGCLPNCQTYAVGLEISYFPERTKSVG